MPEWTGAAVAQWLILQSWGRWFDPPLLQSFGWDFKPRSRLSDLVVGGTLNSKLHSTPRLNGRHVKFARDPLRSRFPRTSEKEIHPLDLYSVQHILFLENFSTGNLIVVVNEIVIQYTKTFFRNRKKKSPRSRESGFFFYWFLK